MRRPIIRSLCRAALLLSVVFLLPVLLIRAQPYDDSDLRAFLTPPEDCPAPCFMDIRPGMTTAEEAVSILDAHPWVLWNKKVPASYQKSLTAHLGLERASARLA